MNTMVKSEAGRKVGIDSRDLSELRQARAELVKENEDLKAQLAKAKAEAADARTLQSIVDLSDEAFRILNANALEIPQGADLMAPTGMEPEMRAHMNFMSAFERILDGFDRALNGFQSSKGRKFFGVVDNCTYWKKELAKLAAAGDALMITNGDGSGSRPTKDAFVPYTRWAEAEELRALLEDVRGRFIEAYDMVSNGAEYKPFEERMEDYRGKQQEAAERAEKGAARVDDLLRNAPALADLMAMKPRK